MNEIKCIENYTRLKIMFEKGRKGNSKYFATQLGVSMRTFSRMVQMLRELDRLSIVYSRQRNEYYLE